MLVVTLTLDRVFDVQRETGTDGNQPCTTFSFEASGQRHFAINAPGHPVLEAGHCLSFVLGRPGHWQTVQGWRNHSTGEVVLPRAAYAFLGLLGGLLMSVLSLVALWHSVDTGSGAWGAALGLAVGVCTSAGLGRQWRQACEAIELIEAMPPSSGAAAAPEAPNPSA